MISTDPSCMKCILSQSCLVSDHGRLHGAGIVIWIVVECSPAGSDCGSK